MHPNTEIPTSSDKLQTQCHTTSLLTFTESISCSSVLQRLSTKNERIAHQITKPRNTLEAPIYSQVTSSRPIRYPGNRFLNFIPIKVGTPDFNAQKNLLKYLTLNYHSRIRKNHSTPPNSTLHETNLFHSIDGAKNNRFQTIATPSTVLGNPRPRVTNYRQVATCQFTNLHRHNDSSSVL